MSDFAFDLSALVLPPPSPAPLPPPPTGARSSARFEDHLGQAARTPGKSESEPSRPSPAPEAESTAGAAAATSSDSKPKEASDRASENDTRQPPENKVDDEGRDLSTEELAKEPAAGTDPSAEAAAGAAAAALAADKSAPASKTPGKRRAGELHDSETDKVAGKAAKAVDESPRGKLAKQTSAAKQRGVEPEAVGEPVEGKEAQAVAGSTEELAPSEATLTGDEISLASDADAKSTIDAQANAGVAKVAAAEAAATQRSSQTTSAENGKREEAIAAAELTRASAATEAPNTGRRGRGSKNNEPVASSSTQRSATQQATDAAANASSAAGAEAVAEIARDAAEQVSGKDASSEEVKATDRNEKNEPRISAAPTLLTARNDKGHETSGRAEGLTEAERVRFVQRVAGAFRSLGDEGGEVRLRLSPPELGSLRLELTVREGVMTARLETETSTARNLLLDNLPALRERLAEQNIKVEKFDVDVRDERRQSSGEQFAGQPDQGRQGQHQRQRAFDTRAATAAAARATRGPIKHGDASELNIVI